MQRIVIDVANVVIVIICTSIPDHKPKMEQFFSTEKDDTNHAVFLVHKSRGWEAGCGIVFVCIG